MADDDLDAELALFEQEIEAVGDDADEDEGEQADGDAKSEDPKQPTGNVSAEKEKSTVNVVSRKDANNSGDKLQEVRGRAADQARAGHMSGTVVASSEAVKANPELDWQRELLQRDSESIQALALNLREHAPTNATLRVRDASAPTLVSRAGDARPARPASNGTRDSGGGNGNQSGAWEWNGHQWTLPPAAAASAHPEQERSQGGKDAGNALQEHGSASVEAERRDKRGDRYAGRNQKRKHTGHARGAAGNAWVDQSLADWPDDDFRIFVGDLAPDATEEELRTAFGKYSSYNMSRVVVNKRTGEGAGYGFVSFGKGEDMVAALREMNGKYVGSRPVKLKKSTWQKRELTADRRRDMKEFRASGLIQKQRRNK